MDSFSPPPSLEQGRHVLLETVKTLPQGPGVYHMRSTKGQSLYIGKAKNLYRRVGSYAHVSKLPLRLQRMVSQVARIDIVTTQSEREALLLESNFIKHHQPRYNILLKQDRGFFYLALNLSHPFPGIDIHRGPLLPHLTYFGPFASLRAIEEMRDWIQKVFWIRNCSPSTFSQRTRPCLQYHIRRCSAPCVHKISPQDYGEAVKNAMAYLHGKSNDVQQHLSAQMQKASDDLRFEEAARYRDRLLSLSTLLADQRINVLGIGDADVIALVQKGGLTCAHIFFFRQGRNFGSESFFLNNTEGVTAPEIFSTFLQQFYHEHTPVPLILLNQAPADFSLLQSVVGQNMSQSMQWKVKPTGKKGELVAHATANALEAIDRRLATQLSHKQNIQELTTVFQLPCVPTRIEVYDNSHLQGTHPYGVMIVADLTGFNRKAYRKFSLESSPIFPSDSRKGNDYLMMYTVLKRRLARRHEAHWDLPQLLLIDGGQGHLNIALQVLKEEGLRDLSVIAIAKGPERHAGKERFFMENKEPFSIENSPGLLYYLQRLRDEAHRFAIGTHRAGREKKMVRSVLDDIPGVGPQRKRALLQHFGSAQRVQQATLKELSMVEGVHQSTAQRIYEYFHGSLPISS